MSREISELIEHWGNMLADLDQDVSPKMRRRLTRTIELLEELDKIKEKEE